MYYNLTQSKKVMIKYKPDTVSVVFNEIPDEVTLAIEITNCPGMCEGCHSPWLREDIGEELTPEKLSELIDANKGVVVVLNHQVFKIIHRGAVAIVKNKIDVIVGLIKHIFSKREIRLLVVQHSKYCGHNVGLLHQSSGVALDG